MSAFFVHDLKNTASTLSLMLQNLPVYYQNPQFREDALRGISKTVAHINDVISRLTVLRHELAVQAVECDLNGLVTDTLKAQEQAPGVEFVKELRCGMSADFMQRSLFRPFQTTKKKGIGIGMFHSKMIVEAHRGRIEVESEPGKGTAFRILLPI